MVIDKTTKNWVTNSRFPDSNYTEFPDDVVWVVPDNTELSEKVVSFGLRWNPITDDAGNLVDVEWDGTEPTKPESAQDPKPEENVWDELDAAYQEGVNMAYDQ